jgi:predicted transcriptional regulator
MSTYIPKQIKPVRERVEAKLDQDLIRELEEYCQYLDSDRDYVIAQALRVAFRKDKGFAEWRIRTADIEDGMPKTRSLK